MNRLAAIVIFSALATACGPSTTKVQEEQRAASNPTFRVDKLFIHDGVTVYRFRDDSDGGDGRIHYFAVPNSGAPAETHTAWSEGCGKNCTELLQDTVTTTAVRK